LQSRKEEIERLRLKCHVLAEQVRQPKTLQNLVNQIEKLIRTKVKREIAELLQLNQQALEAFLTSIFADEKTWFAVSSFIASVVTGHVYITTGAALAALSSIGSKAFKAAADRRQKLKQNDYALVYTISRKVS
jgi:formate dehydrogenase maturation protein FdhE